MRIRLSSEVDRCQIVNMVEHGRMNETNVVSTLGPKILTGQMFHPLILRGRLGNRFLRFRRQSGRTR